MHIKAQIAKELLAKLVRSFHFQLVHQGSNPVGRICHALCMKMYVSGLGFWALCLNYDIPVPLALRGLLDISL